MTDAAAIERLFHWLVGGAQPPERCEAAIARLMEGLVAAGVPVGRFAAFILTIHPTIAGKRISWRPSTGVEVYPVPHGYFGSEVYLRSPVRLIYETGATIRRRFVDGAEAGFADIDELRASGVTDYYAQPMIHVDGARQAMSWSTDAPEGFSPEAIAALDRLNPPLTRLIEIDTLKSNTSAILSTYVGRGAGAEVLSGQIVRGDGERIPSVILFADLKDFTARSNESAPEAMIGALNRFFGAAESAIEGRGGEVLKLIGDGVLAIFPTARAPDAPAAAIDAVDEARATLGAEAPFRAALHLGEVFYGNVGGEARLDFTAVGRDVNLAARLLAIAGTLGADAVCSAAFAPFAAGRATSAGEMELRGFPSPEPVYRLRPPRPTPPPTPHVSERR